MNVSIESCTSARVYRPDSVRQYLILSILIALYSISLPFCYYTAGEPRKDAMIQAQKIADDKWNADFHHVQNLTEAVSLASFSAESLASPQSAHNAEIEDVFFQENENIDADTSTVAGTQSSWFTNWIGPSKEQRRAKAEFEKWQKDLKEKSGNPISLPPEYLPSAWACLAIFATLTIHALFFLMCHWLVEFKAFMLFRSANKVDENCVVLVKPPANRGSLALVSVKTTPDQRSSTFFIEFQRQKYVYTPSAKLGDQAAKYPGGIFTLNVYPIALPLSHYFTYSGLSTETEILKLTDKWGKNHLAVTMPSFLELLQQQLLSPLAIFQVFCALLWLLDEYWSYTFFSLVSVIVYEATTVFQRTRTQQMLGGMAPKPTPIYVFRLNKWSIVTSKDLLPGDIISLSFKKRSTKQSVVANKSILTEAKRELPEIDQSSLTTNNDLIPCDCLLIRGSAIVNEASLTGESVPQMKEALSPINSVENDAETPRLDVNNLHRVHTLFSGCSLVTVTGERKDGTDQDNFPCHLHVPPAPNGGAIAYVLRTGFGSSQGTLLQMIEFSQQSVTGDSKETGLALFLLFIFALAASGYVLREGLRKKEKTTHEILLRCVIIITSVVPRQFPMQMAVAVNMALMTLSKAGIFCTEPFRVPLAGKISHCLFDKTGTITTDQLMPAGIINFNSSSHTFGEEVEVNAARVGNEVEVQPSLSPVTSASAETALILAACHSLVTLKGEEASASEDIYSNLIGDPIELAAIKAIEWSWDGESSTASPNGTYKKLQRCVSLAEEQLRKLYGLPTDMRGPGYSNELSTLEREVHLLKERSLNAKAKLSSAFYHSVHVAHRHHFSSALQRMSVVAKCSNRVPNSDELSSSTPQSSSSAGDHWYCLVKGSPEALKPLILPALLPKWYSEVYEDLASAGYRVLALAYKSVSVKERPHDQPRAWVESELAFGGFIAFECKIRSDSGVVIRSLIDSDHKVSMLTGDALLTSLHVAKLVNICDPKKKSLSLCVQKPSNDMILYKNLISQQTGWTLHWKLIGKNSKAQDILPFDIQAISQLREKYNLLTSEEAFLFSVESSGGKNSDMWKHTADFKVFSRMSPHGKAAIVRAIQEADKDHHILMCGDGGNDVGALKQADVGLALLGGHSNSNTSDNVAAGITNHPVGGELKAEDILNAHQKKLETRNKALEKARAAHMKKFQANYQREQQLMLTEEIRKRTEKGEYTAMFNLMKEQAVEMKRVMTEENLRFMALHGQVWDPKVDGDGVKTGEKSSLEQLLETSDSSGLSVVRPGDASVAAPFTSRIPSIRAVVDMIRQGRCTLLSALMQQQIMMLESIISAYTLSALSLHNARSSERQMMASSWLVLTAAVSFSYAAPVDQMHPLRPLRSLFHPAIIFSIFGQALIHIGCMTLAVHWATEAMGPAKLQEVTEFFKKAKSNDIDRAAHCTEDDMMCQFQAYWMAPFLPNLLNSVVFLVETSQMISVFFANYKGRPWMKGMMENHPLFLSVFVCIGGVTVAAWEMVPQLNELIQLAPFPDDAFRYKVLFLVISTIIGTFLWDRLCVMVFAPKVFLASIDEAKKISWKDVVPIGMTLIKVAACLVLLGTGNLLLIGMAFWWYRSYVSKQQQ